MYFLTWLAWCFITLFIVIDIFSVYKIIVEISKYFLKGSFSGALEASGSKNFRAHQFSPFILRLVRGPWRPDAVVKWGNSLSLELWWSFGTFEGDLRKSDETFPFFANLFFGAN